MTFFVISSMVLGLLDKLQMYLMDLLWLLLGLGQVEV